MANTDKTALSYKAVTGKNPRTGETLVRPQLVNVPTLYVDSVVRRALERSYIRGQFEDMRGVAMGLFEAQAKLLAEGNAINTDWLRMEPVLTGSLDESGTISDDNKLALAIQALDKLKLDRDGFSFSKTGDTSAKITIISISSPGGKKGEMIKSKAIVVTGTNLAYNHDDWDDHVVWYWTDADGKECKLECAPTEVSATYMRFDYDSAFDTIPVGNEVTIEFKLHGSAEGAEQVSTKTVTFVAA